MRRHGRLARARQELDCTERYVPFPHVRMPPLTKYFVVVRYLHWLSIKSKTFNVGQYRRTATPNPSAEFFDTSNPEGERLRKAAAEAAVNDMCKWFSEGKGLVAILDATNSTKSRRRWIQERCTADNIETLFVESKCDDEELIMSNILEVKTTSPDYVGQDPEAAAADFRNRIRNYEKVYQTIDEDERDLTYVKLINVGKQVIINQIQDYLQSRVVYYLMNLHIKPRSIWLSRVSWHHDAWSSMLTMVARRVGIQPHRADWRRREPLSPWRRLRACAPRSRRKVRRRWPQAHGMDIDLEANNSDGTILAL